MRRALRAPLVRCDTNQQSRVPLSCAANVPPAVLILQEVGEEADVLHRQPQDLVFAQLLVWRVSGDEFAELCKGAVHILLAPAFTTVCEDAAHDLRLAGWKGRKGGENGDME